MVAEAREGLVPGVGCLCRAEITGWLLSCLGPFLAQVSGQAPCRTSSLETSNSSKFKTSESHQQQYIYEYKVVSRTMYLRVQCIYEYNVFMSLMYL